MSRKTWAGYWLVKRELLMTDSVERTKLSYPGALTLASWASVNSMLHDQALFLEKPVLPLLADAVVFTNTRGMYCAGLYLQNIFDPVRITVTKITVEAS
jgi:hypothetical protein